MSIPLVPVKRLYERLEQEGITTIKQGDAWWRGKVKNGSLPSLFPANAHKRLKPSWIEEIITAFKPGGPYRWRP